MGLHVAPHTAPGRTRPLAQRCAPQCRRLLRRQRRHGPHRPQPLAPVGRRERRPNLACPVVGQVGLTRLCLRPRPRGLGHTPHRHAREGHLRLPGPRRLGLACVPAPLGRRLLQGARGAVAGAAPRHQGWRWGGRRGLAPRRRTSQAARGRVPAATGQTRRRAQAAAHRPRAGGRTGLGGHGVAGRPARRRPS
jgi:hypothetical protein